MLVRLSVILFVLSWLSRWLVSEVCACCCSYCSYLFVPICLLTFKLGVYDCYVPHCQSVHCVSIVVVF